jgi:prepilin-type processing-associated H-X9-DG protein
MDSTNSDSPPPRPLQFGLKTMLAITTAFAALFAAGSWFGVQGALAFLLLAALLALLFAPRMALGDKIVLGVLLFLLAGCLWPAFQEPRGPSRRSQCWNNLKQIGLALQNYADVYRCFPPAYLTDQNGKPMHSWRVLILPFMEQKALYDRYDFNEPWNGPHNSLLAKEMPPVFRCPSDAANDGMTTDYVAIVGPETMWQADRGARFDEFKDGTSNTLAVVEAAGAKINWMAPRDLPFAAVAKGINPKQGVGISSQHPGRAIAVFADGHTQLLQDALPVESLKALCTKAGGEVIEGEF